MYMREKLPTMMGSQESAVPQTMTTRPMIGNAPGTDERIPQPDGMSGDTQMMSGIPPWMPPREPGMLGLGSNHDPQGPGMAPLSSMGGNLQMPQMALGAGGPAPGGMPPMSSMMAAAGGGVSNHAPMPQTPMGLGGMPQTGGVHGVSQPMPRMGGLDPTNPMGRGAPPTMMGGGGLAGMAGNPRRQQLAQMLARFGRGGSRRV